MAKFWNFKAKTADIAELMLYGPISEDSWWGDEVTPKQFAQDLKDIGEVSELHIRINSGGGDVFAANTIYNLIRSKSCKKIVHIDGLAASAASVIAMVGDEIIMPGNALMMIHDPWTYTRGNSAELAETIELLNKVKDTLVFAYKEKTKKTEEEISDLMAAETWMTGEEAVEMGFADTLEGEVYVAASMVPEKDKTLMVFNGVTVDINRYKNGDAVRDRLQNLVHKKGEDVMTLEQILNKLSEEEQNLIKAELAKTAAPDAESEVLKNEVATLKATEATLQNEIVDLTAKLEGVVAKTTTEDELLNAVDPKIKSMIEDARKNEAAAQAALQQIKDDQENKEFQALAASFDKLPISAQEFGPVLKNFAKADKEGFEKLQALLHTVNSSTEMGTIFKNAGVAGDVTTGSAWDQIQAKVTVLMAEDEKLNKASAMVQVMKNEPKLYEQYRNELTDDSTNVE